MGIANIHMAHSSTVALDAAAPTSDLPGFPELGLDSSALIEAVLSGVPTERFDSLLTALAIPASELARVLHLAPSTLSRRRQRGRFDPLESERLVRLGQLVAQATEVMENLDDARVWLTNPVRALGGETPLHYAQVEPGAREVERLLVRLEHGVYS